MSEQAGGVFSEFREGFRYFGVLLSTVVSSVLLSLVYLCGVGPTWLVAKLAGKEFLETQLRSKTYWEPLGLGEEPRDHYYRQF